LRRIRIMSKPYPAERRARAVHVHPLPDDDHTAPCIDVLVPKAERLADSKTFSSGPLSVA
jgi:hypothetical protein